MGKICIVRTTGRVREWVRNGELTVYDPAIHDVIISDTPPPDGMYWTGAAWAPIPPKTDAEKDSELQAHLDSVGGRIDKMFATILIQKGVCTQAELRQVYRSLG